MKLEGEARGADEDLLSGSGGPPVHLTDRPLNILATAWVFHGVTNTFDGVANTFDGVTATLPPGPTFGIPSRSRPTSTRVATDIDLRFGA
jgi:hypothetical protein